MTLASRIHDLTLAIATAINDRAPRVGASAYDLAKINGFTGSQAAYLSGKAVLTMTKAQRLALTGVDERWEGRLVTDSGTQITWRWDATTNLWRIWTIPWTAYTPLGTNLTPGTGGTVVYRYRVVNGDLHVFGRAVLGTGAAVGTVWQLVLPVNPDTGAPWAIEDPDYTRSGLGTAQVPGQLTAPLWAYLAPYSGAQKQVLVMPVRTDLSVATDQGANLGGVFGANAGQTFQGEIVVRPV